MSVRGAAEVDDRHERLFVALTTGTTHLLLPGEKPGEESGSNEPVLTGPIYHSLNEMPSLAELLAQHRIHTVLWEREAPATSPWRTVTATAIASAIATLGWIFFASGLISSGLHMNAWVGATLALGGIGLLVTLVTALRDQG